MIRKPQALSFHKLLQYVWNQSNFYHEYYSSYGIKERDLANVTVRDLPLVTKNTLMENFDAVVTDSRLRKTVLEKWLQNNHDPRQNFHDNFVVVHSSGSSGNIGIFVYDLATWQLANSVLASHLPALVNNGERKTRFAFYLASHGHFAGVSTAVRMRPDVNEWLILSVLEPVENVVAQLNNFQPHQLGGYSSVVATLAELELKGKLHIQPQRIIVSGDKLTSSMGHTIYEAWRAPIYDVYSASEATWIALKESEQDQMVVLDELNIVEVLTDKNEPATLGGEGRVIVTNLYNCILPILRYELGDHVVLGLEQSKAPFTTIRDIRGRASTALPVILNDGTRDAINHIVLSEFYVPGVEKVQFISKRPDHVQVIYTGQSDLDSLVSEQFQRILKMKGASQTSFEIVRREHIANDPTTGKFAVVKIENSEAQENFDTSKGNSGTGEPTKPAHAN
jgi:phenylacetate-coenzyme A ligase PaaK-like adenylate-forming protein